MELQPFRKKDKPKYVEHESRFAKKNNMRQTISSGRFGFMKGDSYDRDFNVDNKQTLSHGFTIDHRDWMSFAKRARLARRIAVYNIEFLAVDPPLNLIVMPADDWQGMKEQLERLNNPEGGSRIAPVRAGRATPKTNGAPNRIKIKRTAR